MAFIFVIEDEHVLAKSIAQFLQRKGHEVRIFTRGEEGISAYRERTPDIVLLDYRLPGKDGVVILRELKEMDPDPAVIMMTAYGTVENAVEAMKLGAYDYITKPVDLYKLGAQIDKIIGQIKLQQEINYYRGRSMEVLDRPGIVGKSPVITKLVERIHSLAKYDEQPQGGPTVLISGETGTGKGVFAKAIHQIGPRSNMPFIEINCTAIPNDLIEGELFGFRKGAFTDAKMNKAGLLEAAEQGTLFLDEIGHLNLDTQSKLLKVVEEKTVRRLGEIDSRQINIKIIAATNQDLDAARKKGTFREDLYHRLNVIRLELPPLRERGEDVFLLADYFLERFGNKYSKSIKGFTDEARDAMLRYPWPGNVRELNNVIERAVLLEDVEYLAPEHLGLTGSAVSAASAVIEQIESRPADKSEPVTAGCKVNLPSDGVVLDDIEQDLIRQALEKTRWNRSMAAKMLGITLDTLRYRIKKYNIDIEG